MLDMGFMREYIEDLPYTGEVMNLSLENWQDWPAREQISFINRLEEKINLLPGITRPYGPLGLAGRRSDIW